MFRIISTKKYNKLHEDIDLLVAKCASYCRENEALRSTIKAMTERQRLDPFSGRTVPRRVVPKSPPPSAHVPPVAPQSQFRAGPTWSPTLNQERTSDDVATAAAIAGVGVAIIDALNKYEARTPEPEPTRSGGGGDFAGGGASGSWSRSEPNFDNVESGSSSTADSSSSDNP